MIFARPLPGAVLGLAFAFIFTSLLAQPAPAARAKFDPTQPCETLLVYEDVVDKVMVGAWTSGYLAKTEGSFRVMGPNELSGILTVLENLCRQNPGTRFSTLVDRLTKNLVENKRPGPSVDGRKLLRQFFAVDADFAALTAALRPTPQDVQAVYGEPLASRLIASYAKLFRPGVEIKPKPEHDDMITLFTTTGKLKSGAPVLDEFPGGYKKVLPYIISDVPIGRFKFVRSGESLGLAFDGLIFVNDRWVLMPKPWRSLE
jgi:hypothetical protein